MYGGLEVSEYFLTFKRKFMRTIKIISTIILLGMLINSCSKGDSYGSSGGGGPTGSSNVVAIQNMQFQPAAITVTEGTSVTWRNMDAETHTVTSDDGTSFNSGNISSQGSYSFAPTAGAHPYHCSIHPAEKGTVYVAVMGH